MYIYIYVNIYIHIVCACVCVSHGTEVEDFHTLSKEYIFTLNVCATQELHRKIISQEERIRELEAKMTDILKYLSL